MCVLASNISRVLCKKHVNPLFEKIELDSVYESPLNSLHILLPHSKFLPNLARFLKMFNFCNFEKWRQNWACHFAAKGG